jgi:hypothetical protein
MLLQRTNEALGRAQVPRGYSPYVLQVLADSVNQAFAAGKVSSFARRHLFVGGCPRRWSNGAVIAYSQDAWGTPGTAAANFLFATFDAFTGGGIQIGMPVNSGLHSVIFTSAMAILNYLPNYGPPAPLTAFRIDPSSDGGLFGGWVVAARLNLDYTDGGYLPGSAGVRWGDLRLCELQTYRAFNGLSIREFVDLSQRVFGGEFPQPDDGFTLTDLWDVLNDLDHAFDNGVPTAFAETHIFNGSCPN